MAWMVHDYPDPPLGWMDAEWPIRDEWEEFYLDVEDEYDEESFP